YLRGRVGRPIIYNDCFEVRVVELLHTVESVSDCRCTIVAADHYRNSRPVCAGWEWGFFGGSSDSAKSRLWCSIAGRQPESPVFYQVLSMVPFVCPGEDYDPAAALFED